MARCGVGSDFFDLGGRSVEAMLAGRINAALKVRTTMAGLFEDGRSVRGADRG